MHNRDKNIIPILFIFITFTFSICTIIYELFGFNSFIWMGTCLIGLISMIYIFSEKNSPLFYGGKIFVLAYVIYFTIGSIQWIPDPHVYWAFWLEPVSFKAVLLMNIGLLCFSIGWLGIIRFKENPPTLFSIDKIYNNKLFILLFTSFLFSLVLSIYMFGKGGIPALSVDAQTARLIFAKNFSMLITIASLSCHVVIYLAIPLWKNARYLKRLFLLVSILISFFILFAFGGRYYVMDPAIVAILLYNFYIKPINIKKITIIGIVGLILFSLYGNYRESQYLGVSRTKIYKEELGFPNDFSAMMVPALQYIKVPSIVLTHELNVVPNDVPYQMGALLLNPLSEFLPGTHPTEDVWLKDKIMNMSFDIGVGTPGSLLSVFYGDFGWIGVIIQMFLLGFLLKLVISLMIKNKSIQWVLVSSIMIKSVLLGLFLSVFHFFINIIEPVFFLVVINATTTLIGKKYFNKKSYIVLASIFFFISSILCFIWIKTGSFI